jgi:hypothetical protein
MRTERYPGMIPRLAVEETPEYNQHDGGITDINIAEY